MTAVSPQLPVIFLDCHRTMACGMCDAYLNTMLKFDDLKDDETIFTPNASYGGDAYRFYQQSEGMTMTLEQCYQHMDRQRLQHMTAQEIKDNYLVSDALRKEYEDYEIKR